MNTIVTTVTDDGTVSTVINPPAPEPVYRVDDELIASRKALESALAHERADRAMEVAELEAKLTLAQSMAVDESIRHDSPREVKVAAMCHEANRQYCRTIGDVSQVAWGVAPGWQQASAINGVRGIIDGTITGPGQSHASWLAEKIADGWVYGPVKNPDAKIHPCILPFEELPPEQQAKDFIFFNVATVLLAQIR
jgi:hypothetical protein